MFDVDSLRVDEIREDQEYHGWRIGLTSYLGRTRIPVRVDIGFGDVIEPAAREVSYPVMLEMPAPKVRTYPPETVVAEKLQAMVVLGIRNSRMKDFYDLFVISKELDFDGTSLAQAITATFSRRQTPVPETTPVALSDDFGRDNDKIAQWHAFLNRNRLCPSLRDFRQVLNQIALFLSPPLDAIRKREGFVRKWTGGGPWKECP